MNITTSSSSTITKRQFPHLFNLKHSDYINNPYRYYAEVRENCPIYKTPYGIYILTQYADIQYALSSKQFIKNYWGPLKDIYGERCYEESGFSLISQWMINKNPPEHTQIRRLLTLALSAKKLNYLHDIVEQIANELIDGFIKEGTANLVTDYAFKLPALVICRLLGIPREDYDFLLKTTSLPSTLLDPTYLSRATLDKANHSVDELKAYFGKLCVERQKNLGDDLISLLLEARRREDFSLPEVDLVSNIFFLFGAGHETTMNLIANGLYTLHTHLDQLKLLKENEELISNAIIEILRYEAPVQIASPSVAAEDVDINGFVIAKNQIIMPILGSACRDPKEYPDPDRFFITRDHKSTLAFGYGIHLCLGAQLAKIEGAIAINRLLQRIPALNISNLDEPKWKRVLSVRGLTELLGYW